MAELVRLEDWTVRFGDAGARPVLAGVDLAVAPGEAVALVGPSGSGKSLTALSLCGLLPPDARTSGRVRWRDRVLGAADDPGWRAVRGAGVTLVPQEPALALNPVLRVGDQVAETVRRHAGGSARAARARAVELLAEVRLPDPEAAARSWPHQLSGGMQQRAVLAAALACAPQLLVADEPTTALDPTVQAAVLALLDELRRRRGMALLFITHDRHLVPLLADRRVELAAGRVVAAGPAGPAGPDAAAAATRATAAADAAPVLVGRGLRLRYAAAAAPAVAGVDIGIHAGEVVGLAGESGSGKTSLGRLLSGHRRPDAGAVTLAGTDLSAAGGAARRALRRRVQLLFQHAGASLDPRQTVDSCLAEAAGRPVDAADLLAEVDLEPALASRLPHRLSGGQRQRVALARCLAASPLALVADEPASALDPRTRRRVLDLLLRAAAGRRLALLLIGHDVDELLGICDRVAVMLGGVVVEDLPSRGAVPRHPYTCTLLAAQPARLVGLGEAWRAATAATGGEGRADAAACPWRHACPLVKPQCHKELPDLESIAPGHLLRCPVVAAGGASQFIDTP